MDNPTKEINLSFSNYVSERTTKEAKHLVAGIPDYAYGSDYALRQKIRNMPGIYPFFKAATEYIVPMYRQMENAQCIKVTPKQFPKLYEITEFCAETLGIGIPTVFVDTGVSFADYTINACAYCTDDSNPLIAITSAAVERLNDDELMAIMAHECGHIHNNHVIYNQIVNTLINGTINLGLNSGMRVPSGLLQLLTDSISTALLAWSRAAEVTADRAACICCGGAEADITLRMKSMAGGVWNQKEYNLEEVLKQYDDMGTMMKYIEMVNSTHPLSVRRILANQEFVKSEVFYSWHPELKKPDMKLYSKEELDARCGKFINVLENGKR